MKNDLNNRIKRKLKRLKIKAFPKLAATTVDAFHKQPAPNEFDEGFYLQTYPEIRNQRRFSAYENFSRYGHIEMRNPSADFDTVWYMHNYSHHFNIAQINPLQHYLQHGKAMGFTPHPPRQVRFNEKTSRPFPEAGSRACLFAAYDADSRIDETVLIYLRDMAKHADVYYMADCDMPESELAKLDGIVKKAWAWRHGAYDFGSYSILARDLVGWDALAEYDEVVFANDSCYLVKPLEETFTRMAKKKCAWWGLQATKGIAATRKAQPFPSADGILDIDDIRTNLLDQFENDPIYDFHIGSYFLAFRSDIIKNEAFQRIINNIKLEQRKRSIVEKYEVGVTHFLIGHGYEFATWAQTVTKAHPVYTNVAFDFIKCGFPLFKRFMLSENPYKVSSIAYWKVVLSQQQSLTSVAQIEDNVLRVSNADKLYRNFNIIEDGQLPPVPMTAEEFEVYDEKCPKYDHYWGFPVCYLDHTLSDNSRAVFESVKDDPEITKIIFTRERTIQTGGVNVICVPLRTLEGQAYLARCRNFFVKHSVKNLHWPVSAEHHNIINLWHGIPLKRIGMVSLDVGDQAEKRAEDNKKLRAVISASDVDRLAMAAAYTPMTYEDIWLTGLPRHDVITNAESKLPEYLNLQFQDIRQLVDGRGLILFCPTFRNDQKAGYYNFTPEQVAVLSDWLTTHNMVLGIREHPADKAKQYSSQLRGDRFLHLPAGRFPCVEVLYREALMLITDYSSCFIDYMLTGQPMISFAFDLESYKERERGLFYELEDVFPGLIAQNFDDLVAALEKTVKTVYDPPSHSYVNQRNFFIKHTDDGNTKRVVERVKAISEGSTFVTDFVTEKMPKKPKSIIFLYGTGNGITNRYRIFAHISQMRKLGWTCYALDINNASYELLAKVEFVSFCRLQLSMRSLDMAEFIRATGGKVIYDTDDIIHEEAVLSQAELFTINPKKANSLKLLIKRTDALMKLADGFTVSTSALMHSVKRFNRPAAIVENSISDALLEKYAKKPKPSTSAITNISYLSGTATHAADFNECKLALKEIILSRPDVVLHIVGHLDIEDLAEAVNEGQIKQYGLMSYAAMHEFLRTMDVNLAPLVDNAFNDAKSSLKIFEAALHAVPTIASPTESYREAISDRETGYLASSHQEWLAVLEEVLDNKTLRHKIGDAAKRKIVAKFSAEIAAKNLTNFLNTLRKNNSG